VMEWPAEAVEATFDIDTPEGMEAARGGLAQDRKGAPIKR